MKTNCPEQVAGEISGTATWGGLGLDKLQLPTLQADVAASCCPSLSLGRGCERDRPDSQGYLLFDADDLELVLISNFFPVELCSQWFRNAAGSHLGHIREEHEVGLQAGWQDETSDCNFEIASFSLHNPSGVLESSWSKAVIAESRAGLVTGKGPWQD